MSNIKQTAMNLNPISIKILNLNESRMSDIIKRVKVFSTGTCPICDKTKILLHKWNIPFEEARVDQNQNAYQEMAKKTNNARSVPQITIDGIWIGGFTELTMKHMDNELDDLMQSE